MSQHKLVLKISSYKHTASSRSKLFSFAINVIECMTSYYENPTSIGLLQMSSFLQVFWQANKNKVKEWCPITG